MTEEPQVNNEAWLLPTKVASYPTVNATYNTASSLYTATKNYNRLTEFTADLAERTAAAVAQPLYNASKPLITRMEPQLHVYDKYATEQLEKLEEKAPLMNEEPAKIYEVARDTTVTRINQSYAGQAVSYAIQPMLSVAEKFTAKPEKAPENEAATEDMDQGESAPNDSKDDVSLNQTIKRAYKVGTKLQQRALEKAMENVTSLRKRSQETLATLTHAVDLIQYAKSIENGTGAHKVREFFQEILEDEEAAVECEGEATIDEESNETTTREQADIKRKTLVVSRNLSRKLKTGYESTIVYAKPYLTESMFAQLQHGQTLLEGIHKTFAEAKTLKDVSDTWLESTKANLQYLSQSLNKLSHETAEYIGTKPPASWFYSKSTDGAQTDGVKRQDSGSSYAPSESLDGELEPKSRGDSQEGSDNDYFDEKRDEDSDGN